MTAQEKILYTGKTHTTGGREGFARSDDARLEVRLSSPGSDKPGNCFIGALGLAAAQRKLQLPAETAVDAEVDLAKAEGGFFLRARLAVSLPGIASDLARSLIAEAHQTCPYSKATRGNIEVDLTLA
ncbi:Ohr family peroxiredoxin [Sinorhizobium medicae]|nr:Ohr family peroxiredoxin [Sinorhizobium medicae]